MYLAARGPGKPHILQINDLFIIDTELKLISSIATQQKSIFSFRTRLECPFSVSVQTNRLCCRIKSVSAALFHNRPYPFVEMRNGIAIFVLAWSSRTGYRVDSKIPPDVVPIRKGLHQGRKENPGESHRCAFLRHRQALSFDRRGLVRSTQVCPAAVRNRTDFVAAVIPTLSTSVVIETVEALEETVNGAPPHGRITSGTIDFGNSSVRPASTRMTLSEQTDTRRAPVEERNVTLFAFRSIAWAFTRNGPITYAGACCHSERSKKYSQIRRHQLSLL